MSNVRKLPSDMPAEIAKLKKKLEDERLNLTAFENQRVQQLKTIDLLRGEINSLEIAYKKQQAQAKPMELRVSDHALVRYLERRLGLDMDVIRAEILDDDFLAAFKMSNGTFKHKGFVVTEGVVVTTIPTEFDV